MHLPALVLLVPPRDKPKKRGPKEERLKLTGDPKAMLDKLLHKKPAS